MFHNISYSCSRSINCFVSLRVKLILSELKRNRSEHNRFRNEIECEMSKLSMLGQKLLASAKLVRQIAYRWQEAIHTVQKVNSGQLAASNYTGYYSKIYNYPWCSHAIGQFQSASGQFLQPVCGHLQNSIIRHPNNRHSR